MKRNNLFVIAGMLFLAIGLPGCITPDDNDTTQNSDQDVSIIQYFYGLIPGGGGGGGGGTGGTTCGGTDQINCGGLSGTLTVSIVTDANGQWLKGLLNGNDIVAAANAAGDDVYLQFQKVDGTPIAEFDRLSTRPAGGEDGVVDLTTAEALPAGATVKLAVVIHPGGGDGACNAQACATVVLP